MDTPVEFSLIKRASPSRFLEWVGVEGAGDGLRKRVGLGLLLITWVPFSMCALVERLLHGSWPAESLDLAVHARMLVALPLFTFADRVVDLTTMRCSKRFTSEAIMGNPEEARRAVAKAARWRDARVVDVVLLSLALLGGQLALWSSTRVGYLQNLDAPAQWSLARVIYSVLGLPAFQFLLARWLWRWGIWSLLLWRWSRQPLRLEAGHPDHAGGIAFSTEPSVAMAPVLMACSAVIAAHWLTLIFHGHATASGFENPGALVVVLALLMVFGPVFAFTPQLVRARLNERPQMSSFTRHAARRFRERWVDGPFDPGIVGTGVIQDMASLRELYENVQKTRPHPASTTALATVVGAVLTPMAPIALTVIPLEQAVRKLVEALVGV